MNKPSIRLFFNETIHTGKFVKTDPFWGIVFLFFTPPYIHQMQRLIHIWLYFEKCAGIDSSLCCFLAISELYSGHKIIGQDMLTYLSVTGPNLESFMTCFLFDCCCPEPNFVANHYYPKMLTSWDCVCHQTTWAR